MFILFPVSGLTLLIIAQPLVSLLHYTPYETYISLLPVLPAFVDSTFTCPAPILIEHLSFQTDSFWRPYYSRQSPREKPNLRHLFSISIHDDVFKTSYFILSVVRIFLHLIILTFFEMQPIMIVIVTFASTSLGTHSYSWLSSIPKTHLLTLYLAQTMSLLKIKCNWTPSDRNTTYKKL